MKISGIYKILNIITKKIYIGSAIDIQHRWREHRFELLHNNHHSILLQRAWNKYGSDQFVFEIIELIENKIKLIEREQYWIDFCNSANSEKGYNISPIAGSQLGFRHSEETKEKIRQGHLDKPLSISHKQQISISNLGKVVSEETKYRMQIAALNMSNEHKEKIHQSKLGKISPIKGIHYKLFCINNHDINIYGRTNGGTCRECKRMYRRINKLKVF